MTQAERIAQAALRGFFGDPTGFQNMSSTERQRAALRVQAMLESFAPVQVGLSPSQLDEEEERLP
jgi:hypothetical protein